MDINKLYYFFAAAESDSFTRAAEHCHIAQTTMSKYIAQLEEETGCTLFLRSKSGLTLTEEGKRFYEGMKEIDRKYRALLSSLAPQKALCHLGLASQEFKGLDFLPAFQKAFPEISLSCHMAPVPELENGLEAGTLDGIIAPDAIIFPKRFATIPLMPVPQCLVCSEAHAQSLKDIPQHSFCPSFPHEGGQSILCGFVPKEISGSVPCFLWNERDHPHLYGTASSPVPGAWFLHPSLHPRQHRKRSSPVSPSSHL
jgi:DNA-binding transcriptional LysR family regulator